MKKLLWYTLNLQLFAGEGEAAADGETGDKLADAGQNSTQDCENEFSQLINGKFKEQFTKKTQAIIDKRFKQTKELEEYKSKISPLVEKLMEKYGLEPGQEDMLPEAIGGALEENNSAPPEASNREQLKGKIGGWLKESEELKQLLPDFDLRNELRENKLFSQLLLSGVPLKTAYETVHRDEFLSGAMQYTASAVRQQMVQSIEAKGRRPIENGISAEGAVVTAVDVNSLTSQDILKILKQVENGAKIKF